MEALRAKRWAWVGILGVFLAAGVVHAGTVYYVDADATGLANGTSWTDAFTHVQDALDAATGGDEVWVAEGAYEEHIVMKNGVGLYGGFDATETSRDQRDWAAHHSILTGGGGPFPAPPIQGAVIVIKDLAGPDTRVDGFTITGGHGYHGGGIHIVGSGPIITHNLITNNRTDGAGAGISIWGFKTTEPVAYPVATRNTIVENYSVNDEGDGGGIAVINSAPEITWNIIARNEATRNGGGIACWRTHMPHIANNYILANSASVPLDANDTPAESTGGGGIFASATDLDGRPINDAFSAPIIVSNVIAANGGNQGAGVCLVDSTLVYLGVAKVLNNTIAANSGSGLYWTNSSPEMRNNIITGNTWGAEKGIIGTTGGTFEYNCVYGNFLKGASTDFEGMPDPTGTAGNISADPQFADAAVGQYHLQPTSPCIGAGSNAFVEADANDIDGQDRIQGDVVDMGADESDGTAWTVPGTVIHVRPDGNDLANGLTWATAKQTVGAGVAAAASGYGEVWVAAGTYTERITLPAYVYLYGGFAGTETARQQRDPSVNATILDGGQQIRVVTCQNSGYRVSLIDGFTIQGGGVFTGGAIGQGLQGINALGGGMYVRVCSPTISNNIIRQNSLGNPFVGGYPKGSGVACYMSYTLITGNTITENEVLPYAGWGGGIYCALGEPDIKANTIADNRARYGSAIGCNNCEARIIDNVIEGNSMYENGQYMGAPEGAVDMWLCSDFLIDRNVIRNNRAWKGAGLTIQSNFAGKVTNNLIADNVTYDPSTYTGGMGGGVYCQVAPNATGDIEIVNNTIVGNTATAYLMEQGGGIAVALPDDKILIANNVIAYNSSGIFRYPVFPLLDPNLVTNCLYNGTYNYVNMSAGPTDIVADPLFVDRPLKNYRLLGSSPCIDGGSDGSVPAGIVSDLAGKARIVDGDGTGGAAVDMGAYERQCVTNPMGDVSYDCCVEFVDYALMVARLNEGGCSTGNSWCHRADVNESGAVNMIDVAILTQHWLEGPG